MVSTNLNLLVKSISNYTYLNLLRKSRGGRCHESYLMLLVIWLVCVLCFKFVAVAKTIEVL